MLFLRASVLALTLCWILKVIYYLGSCHLLFDSLFFLERVVTKNKNVEAKIVGRDFRI